MRRQGGAGDISHDTWNLRTTENPAIRWTGRQLTRWNARHPWDHNAHFHPWILRSLPAGASRVLDVGCGRGELVAVLSAAGRPGLRIDGIDPDPQMAYAAATRTASDPRVRIRRRGLAEQAADPALREGYDALTMVASLHHMELEPALRRARDLLRPGGRLLVVTLTRPVTVPDQMWDVANSLTNPLIGLVKHPRPHRGAETGPQIPVADAAFSIGTLRERAADLLPGARIRRREGFRATLSWQKPD